MRAPRDRAVRRGAAPRARRRRAAAPAWAALLAILYANRDDGAEVTRNFLYGTLLAVAVGLFAHYVLLAQSSSFEQLALVLFPLLMLATKTARNP